MKIIFSEGSGLNDSVFGKCQGPIRMFMEKRGEQFEQQSALKDVFNMGTMKKAMYTYTSMTSMEGPKPVGENGPHPADGMQEGYKKTFTPVTWKNSFSVSREMVDDANLMDLKRRPAAFLASHQRAREHFGAQLFARAMEGDSEMELSGQRFDLTGADQVPLFDTAHPSKVGKSTQCNRFTNQFSMDALDRMESAMHLFRGDNDEILDVAPDTILIPEDPDLKRAVFAGIGADKEPTTANNAFNYQYGRWNVIVWSYLNRFLSKGAKPWVLLDSKYNEMYGGAVWLDRIALEVTSDIDRNTDANVWYGYSRFVAGFYDWRFAAVGGVDDGETLAS